MRKPSLVRFIKKIKRKLGIYSETQKSFRRVLGGRDGVEIGGPSRIFWREVPVYPILRSLDGVNFGRETVWEGSLAEGATFNYYKKRLGHQFISEATDLRVIADHKYDFVLSSNCLEHVANPLMALNEWLRVLKPGGHLLLVLPRKESNFDHRRPVTKFEHLLDDMRNCTTEHDLTHLDEILRLHDRSMDAASGDLNAFKARSLLNFENRCLHHHVFDRALIERVLQHFGLELVLWDSTDADYIACARKPG